MTAEAPLPSDTPINRGERLARDVLYALMLEKRPWAEVIANRRAVVMETFRQFDAADEFEGMLAAQMAVAHSIFLGSSFLAVDRARPDGDRAHYLRQAARLMSFYRQHFSLLRQCRKDRERARRAAAATQDPGPADWAPAAIGAFSGKPSLNDHLQPAHRATDRRNPTAADMLPRREPAPAKEGSVPPFAAFPAAKRSRPLLMEGTALARAQGP